MEPFSFRASSIYLICSLFPESYSEIRGIKGIINKTKRVGKRPEVPEESLVDLYDNWRAGGSDTI